MTRLSAPASESPEDVAAAFDVSRETAEALIAFTSLVRRWTKTVNLISPASLPQIWTRHVLDSAQVFHLVPAKPARWLDLGSGGGFPGIVCALLARDAGWDTHFTLVDADRRKLAFLATACRDLGLSVTLLPGRVEEIDAQAADLVTARAFAPLTDLFAMAERHVGPKTILLLPKGARHREEIARAEREWRFTLKVHPSITDPDARILECAGLERREEVSRR